MEASKANLINSLSLIVFGLWGYIDSSSMTALIPVMFGVVLLLCNSGIKKENKLIAHLAVLATIICLLGLFMPLKGAIDRGDNLGIIRVSIMTITCATAVVLLFNPL
mgnify:CR=1 FL=1